MINTLMLSLILLFSAWLGLLPASAMAERPTLAKMPGVEAVYSVDRRHSFVIGHGGFAASDGYRVLGTYEGGGEDSLHGFMVEHAEEPMIGVDPGAGPLSFLDQGAVQLTRDPLMPSSTGYSALDVFEAATLACLHRGARLLYVIPRKYGRFSRLTEVSALEAFRYLLLSGTEGVWFLACDARGEGRFQVMKNYNFVNDGKAVVEFAPGVALEGVDYVRNSRHEARRLTELEGRWSGYKTTLEDTAREIAALKTGFVKNVGGKRYYGTYKGRDETGRCDSVRLERRGEGEKTVVKVVRDFRVCDGRVQALGYTRTERVHENRHAVYRLAGGSRVAVRR